MTAVSVRHLTKRYGAKTAVRDLSFDVDAGSVVGFLGPNGAGKTTTLKVLLGLVGATSGEATIEGVPYNRLRDPVRVLGAVLDGSGYHPRRTGLNHVRTLCVAAGVAQSRAEEVLDLVELTGAASEAVSSYSLGMRQRLGIASSIIGKPKVLVLDEPANGLDPQGVRWLRGLIRAFADDGGAVLISSHVLAEVQQVIDRAVVIAQGVLRADAPLLELLASSLPASRGETAVRVQTSRPAALQQALLFQGLSSQEEDEATLIVLGATVERVATIATQARVPLRGLMVAERSLEDVFLELTKPILEEPGIEKASRAR